MRFGVGQFAWVMVLSCAASAADLGLRADASLVAPVSAPQSSYFGVGAGLAGTGYASLSEAFDLEAHLLTLVLPPAPSSPIGSAASAVGVGVGARVKRPTGQAQVLPWLSLGLGVAVSGSATAWVAPTAGVQFRASPDALVAFGPVLRFVHFAPLQNVAALTAYSADMISLGLSVELLPAPPPRDSDADGVPDARDACPAQAANTSSGCPPKPAVVVTEAQDADHDGVEDAADKCPREAEDRDAFEDGDGCPELDDDGDTVPDVSDTCPRVSGPAALNGCPDGDDDGVADWKDECPKVAGVAPSGGCPAYHDVVVTSKKLEIKQKIFFAFGNADILPRSYPLLGEVAQALQDRDSLCVRVEGYTDAKGNPDSNVKVSQERAQAVVDYLVKHGILAQRLNAKGYGSRFPLDDNSTAEGRENNRRVEFVLRPCGPDVEAR